MTQSPGTHFEQLLDVMARLRGPDGCPWDRAQTPATLKPFLVEEAYEVLEALDRCDPDHVREELGDLLFQVVFHAQVAAEAGQFTMGDVLRSLIDKMVTRHPHVFGTAAVDSPAAALAQWEALKQREAADAGRVRSVIDGVPRALPALLRAQRIQAKAARIHFDWPDSAAAWRKVEEEMEEAAEVVRAGDREGMSEEIGDLLFSLVNVARLAGIDAEHALEGTIEKFGRRFTWMEQKFRGRGISVAEVSTEELEAAWEAAKAHERNASGRP